MLYYEDNWMIGWNASYGSHQYPGLIEVGPWPDRIRGWSDFYDLTTGCCESRWHEASSEEKDDMLRTQFISLVMDGCPHMQVQQEFMKIRRWREMEIDLINGRYIAMQGEEFSPYNP